MELPRPNGIVTLLTDFGCRDPYAGIVRGMVKRVHPLAEVMDLCHEVPAQNIQLGAFFLAAARNRFPPGTVHVAMMDPGEVAKRRVLAVCAAGAYWVGPDNGVLGEVLRREVDAEVRAVELKRVRLPPQSSTSHGRDVYAPLAGMLSSGKVGFRALGPRIQDPVAVLCEGVPRVVHVDHHGNLITNFSPAAGLEAVVVAGRRIPVASCHEDVGKSGLVAVINSYDLLEISAVDGSAAAVLGVQIGEPVERGGG
jgi:S-adenosylmethionine hydrolase